MTTDNRFRSGESRVRRIVGWIRIAAIWILLWTIFNMVASLEVQTFTFVFALGALFLITAFEAVQLISNGFQEFYDDLLGTPDYDREERRHRSAW